MFECVIVGLGGFIGSVSRYLISLIPVREAGLFPIKTFLINLVGCFVIGVVSVLAAKDNLLNPRFVLFLKVGICGGFTTFSSFALETADLAQSGNLKVALAYSVLSVALGVLGVFAGEMAAR